MSSRAALGFVIGLVVVQLVVRLMGGVFSSPAAAPYPSLYTSSLSAIATNAPTVSTDPTVFCWVAFRFPAAPASTPHNEHRSLLISRMRHTFGPQCNRLVVITQNESNSEAEYLHHHYSRLDRHDLWNQVSRGWWLVADKFADKYDWFVKLDADSLFMPGNLRHLVLAKKWDPDSVAYFGHTIYEQSRGVHEPRAQFNLGAGYGVSRGLLKRMAPYFAAPDEALNVLSKQERCPEWNRWGEDVKFADCLRHVFPKLLPNVTRDEHRKETFMPFDPEYHMAIMDRQRVSWYWRGKNPETDSQELLQCCSNRPAIFHDLKSHRSFFSVNYMINDAYVDPM